MVKLNKNYPTDQVRPPEDEQIEITGIVIPVEWDKKGNPVRIAISTYTEQEFLIDGQNKQGREVQHLLRHKVRVNGMLTGFLSGRRIITIKKYIQLKHGPSSKRRPSSKN